MPRPHLLALLPLFLAHVTASVRADTVVLRNGDRLTGTVVNVSADTVRLQTDYAGEIAIERAKVATLTTDEPVPLMIGDRIENGRIGAGENDNVTVAREDGTTGSMPLARIAHIKPTPRQGGPGVNYAGRVNLGYSRSAGNSQNERLYGEGELRARHKDYRWSVGGDARESSDDGVRSESNWRARGNHDWFFRPRQFLYTRATFEHDEFRDIDLRSTVGGGYGYQVLETDTTQLSLQGGVDYVNVQRDVGEDEEYPAAGWGISYEQQVWTGRVVLFHDQDGFWSLEDADDILARTKTGARFPLGNGFSATAQLNLDWDNDPAPGTKSTDETWLFTLGYNW